MNGPGGPLEAGLERFVDRHVRTLLSWEILLFFHGHPEAVLDREALARRLGRRPTDIDDDVEQLCRSEVLSCAGGLIRYEPDPAVAKSLNRFADACSDRTMRLALVAQVLERIDRTFGSS